jgi:hypothetical protein
MEMNDLLSTAVVAAVIVMIFFSTIRRMLDLKSIPFIMWPVLLLAAAMPSHMAYTVLNPGEIFDKAEVRAQKDTFTLEVPADGEYALMVTALLGPEVEDGQTDKTAYTMRLELSGEEHRVTGTIRRDSGSNDVEVDVESGNSSVREHGRRRSGGLGEDLQDRFDIAGSGATLKGTVTNWKGAAAQVLFLEIVKAPPKASLLWAIALSISLVSVLIEAKYVVTEFAGNIGLLTMYAVFLRDGVTPLDTYQGVGLAVLPAAIVGLLLVGVAGQLATKYAQSKRRQAEAT